MARRSSEAGAASGGGPEPDLLTPLQRSVLREVFSDEWFRRNFYLTGGTALAGFHLRHRFSDDLDLFSHGVDLAPVPGLLREVGRRLGERASAETSSPGFMRFRVGAGLKVDVVADVEFRVGAPELVQGFMVDTVKNIAVNKVCAILGRLEAKDFVDLYMILKERNLDVFDLLALGRNKDAGLDPFVWASLLPGVTGLTVLPRMARPIDKAAMDRFFLDLRDAVLDRLDPRRRS